MEEIEKALWIVMGYFFVIVGGLFLALINGGCKIG